MQFLSAITLAILSVGALAAPATNSTKPVIDAANSSGGVYFCTDINYTGTCNHFFFTDAACNSFAPGDTFYKSVSSFGPDSGAVCKMFQNTGCSGYELDITWPGIQDMRDWNFNDQMGSFSCYQSGSG